MTNNGDSTNVELIIANALKMPGVKVNRKEFLVKTFGDKLSSDKIPILIDKGPQEVGIGTDKINRMAKSLVNKRTLQSSGTSFAAGLPGGWAMAATIPADTLQFFGVALRLSQELAYMFGYRDFWDDDELDLERVRSELILFLGVMFGVGGAASTLKVVSSKMAQQALKKLPQKALTKTFYYPIVKKIATLIGVKMTKDTFAKGVSKVIPVVGGVVSGGLTYTSMTKMGNRLRNTMYDSLNYTTQEFQKDMDEIKREMPDIIDIEFEEIEDQYNNDQDKDKDQ
ncbi:bacteriochlorophyll 4-vinyl reductase [Robertmurraya yapensis]|uniref:Bacteriochlorophyll 4-vinyl reductase n=1 Tax=Bacillus yapensis TaxID=2492960 RepID=A0A3S0JPI4_9BACI|nr:bacteriochlorophyll 4-vinyl reductase [Bacillus yapensis]RTR26301.1 bacteriochlorophyll 4-vinyl reductase [Bacillus yapensis]TKS93656.1 bacteriochlorophyll 4-vinyl reductase [Bacillus yapensis]